MSRRQRSIFLSLLLAALAAPLPAQGLRGVIKGTVKDRDGGVLPGATVTANSPALIQKDVNTTTNDRGEYRFPLLDPGVYEIKVAMQGFSTATVSGTRLLLGQTVDLPVTLDLATVKAAVDVVASPIVDKDATKIGTNFTKELLTNIPSNRTLTAIINFTPGANDGTVHGSTERGNALQLDGVNVTDPVVGTQIISFNFDNLEEISVESGGHNAEYGQASGSVVNAVTKSGGNAFSGEGNLYYGGKKLVSLNGEKFAERLKLTPNELDKRLDTQAQIGGPIAKDKIWFFGSYRYFDQDEKVVGFNELANRNQNFGYGKLTWQLSPKNKVVGTYNYDSLTFNNRGASANVPPEGARTQDGLNHTPNFEFTSVLNPTTYFQVRGSFVIDEFNLIPKNDLPGHRSLEVSPTRTLVSDGREDLNNRKRKQFVGSLSRYQDDLAGTHDFKFGFEYEDSDALRDFTASRGLLYYDLGTGTDANPFVPAYVRTIQDPPSKEAINRYSLYAQDSWTIKDRVTINAGIRYDHNASAFPEQKAADGSTIAAIKDVANYSNISPRIGLSFDLGGDGKSVARFAYSRLVDANIIQYFNSINPNAIAGQYRVICGGPADDGTVCQPGEKFSSINLGEFGASNTTIDPSFGSPIIDEYTLGVERELTSNWSFGVNFIDKEENNLPEDVDIGTLYTPVVKTLPGDTLVDSEGNVVAVIPPGTVTVYQFDPVTATQQFLITNPAGAFRQYRALELVLNKRMSNKWQLQSSFVMSRSAGTVGTDFNASTSISGSFDDPNSLINNYGNLEHSRPYAFKLIASYQGPWGVNLSGFYRFQSGEPFTRTARITGVSGGAVTINADRRGSRRQPSQSDLDLRLEKEFRLGFGRLDGILDVFNLFNIDAPITVRTRSAGTGKLGDPTDFRKPREARLAARYIW